MRLYLDASALLKLVFREDGVEEARSIWDDADRIVSVALLPVEARSAVARRLEGRRRAHVRRELSVILDEIELRAVDETLLDGARSAAEDFRLRALDAIHLAAAREIADASLVVATWDRELSQAATAVGLMVYP